MWDPLDQHNKAFVIVVYALRQRAYATASRNSVNAIDTTLNE